MAFTATRCPLPDAEALHRAAQFVDHPHGLVAQHPVLQLAEPTFDGVAIGSAHHRHRRPDDGIVRPRHRNRSFHYGHIMQTAHHQCLHRLRHITPPYVLKQDGARHGALPPSSCYWIYDFPWDGKPRSDPQTTCQRDMQDKKHKPHKGYRGRRMDEYPGQASDIATLESGSVRLSNCRRQQAAGPIQGTGPAGHKANEALTALERLALPSRDLVRTGGASARPASRRRPTAACRVRGWGYRRSGQ